jgi:hypothetical protein
MPATGPDHPSAGDAIEPDCAIIEVDVADLKRRFCF